MGNLTYNPTQLRKTAKEIRDKITEMNTQLTRLDQICDDLKANWKDKTASLVYVSKVEEKRNNTAQIIAKYEELAQRLENVALRVETNTANITEAGGRL